MNKKFILRIFACMFAVVIVIGCFSGCGMDISEIFGIKYSSSKDDSEPFNKDDDHSEADVSDENGDVTPTDYNVYENKERNKLISAKDVIANGEHSNVSVDSWYDDDAYCYVVYLGRVKNFIIHDLYAFEYTKSMPIFGNLSVSLKQIERQTVENTYSSTLQKSTHNTVDEALKSSLSQKLTASYESNLTNEVNSSFESSLQKTWATTCTETNTEVYSSLTDQTNEMIQSFTIDYSKCEEGYFYDFASVVDLDVYAVMSYDYKNGNVRYSYCTNVLGRARKVAFASVFDNYLYDSGAFELDTSNFSFEKPEKYITNHPKQVRSIVGEETYTVSKLTDEVIWITCTVTYENGQETQDYNRVLASQGYDRALVEVSFKFVSEGNAVMHFYLCDTQDKHKTFLTIDDKKDGEKSYSKIIDLADLVNYGKIYFIFGNENVFF